MSKTYDPFALDKPTIKLGAHGEWTLGELHETRRKKLAAVGKAYASLPDDASIHDLARLIGDLCEAACENATGLSDKIVDLSDERHGDNAIGAIGLRGVADHIREWIAFEDSAGEG